MQQANRLCELCLSDHQQGAAARCIDHGDLVDSSTPDHGDARHSMGCLGLAWGASLAFRPIALVLDLAPVVFKIIHSFIQASVTSFVYSRASAPPSCAFVSDQSSCIREDLRETGKSTCKVLRQCAARTGADSPNDPRVWLRLFHCCVMTEFIYPCGIAIGSEGRFAEL